ncbi:MAG TPA: hypothetical protein VG840_06190, partial [Casimicrobiaceae bacterium]|nr:hypothetical protein [Casimicrobiaceae bacterium]
MNERNARPAMYAWLLPLAALVALAAALFDYFWPGNGIHGTGGALLAVVSTAVMLLLALARVRWRTQPSWMHALLLVLLVIDIAGTALAAWLLEATWVFGATIV